MNTLESIGSFVPAVGRTVVYQIAEGQYRPAQIVATWEPSLEGPRRCNLVVFLDGLNDREFGGSVETLTAWRTSVGIGEGVGEYLPRVP